MKTLIGGCRFVALAASVAVVVALVGCSTSFQARSTTESGFLGDYSQLHKGTGDQALEVYIKPDVDWKAYNAILMDPVRVYYSVETGWWTSASQETVQALVNYLDATVRKQLGDSYKFVDQPGPGVLHLRVAITDTQGSNRVLDTASSVIPIGVAANLLKRAVFGENASVGEAGIEGEILDSQSGERLAAAVDKRVGRKYTFKFNKFNAWRVAEDSYDVWALRLRNRLAELRESAPATDR